jgi:unsaturated rhamnogalacturonyl hydrolase
MYNEFIISKMNKRLFIPLVIFIVPSLFIFNNVRSQEFFKSPEEVGRLVVADLLSRAKFMMYETPDVYAVHYAEACAGYGAIKLSGLLGDKTNMQKLIARYDRVTEEKIPNTANHVDVNVYGILPLEIYLQNKDIKYLAQGIELADGQWDNPTPEGLTSQTRFWIDDIYMIGCLQVQAYRATGKMIYLERAALEIDTYIRRLQQPNGLFFHGADAPFFWGRGNGWVAAGIAELLSVLPESNPHYNSIISGYTRMMKALIEYQAEDGMWCQLIDKKESFRETSSTAMFGFAMTEGVRRGILPREPYTTSSVKAWNALMKYLNADGKIENVCIGTPQSKDINFYFERPKTTGDLHGQAPLLWFTYALISKNLQN